MANNPLLPLVPIRDPALMQLMTRWKALLDPIIKGTQPGAFNTATINIPQTNVTFNGTDITNTKLVDLDISTTGNPVLLTVQSRNAVNVHGESDWLSDIGFITWTNLSNTTTQRFSGSLVLTRDNILVFANNYDFLVPVDTTVDADQSLSVYPGVVFQDTGAAAGKHTYTLLMNAVSTTDPTTVMTIIQCALTAVEL